MTMRRNALPEYLQVWQCIGCGRIEMPQACIGVCRDKKVLLVGKDAHERALGEIERLRRLLDTTHSHFVRFAQCTPRPGEEGNTLAVLQAELRRWIQEVSDAISGDAA